MSTGPAPAVASAAEPLPSAEEAQVEASAKTERTPATEKSVIGEAPEVSPKPESVPTTAGQPTTAAEVAKVEDSEPPVVPSKTETAPITGESTPITPIAKLFAELPSIIKEAGHGEMWGVTLGGASDVPTSIVLEKFLRANTKDVPKAKAQLIEALKWRKKMDPVKLMTDTEFDKAKFGDLGYVSVYPKTESHEKEIVTWNIYGGAKNLKETFGNGEEFIKWRSAIMELSVKELDLPSATVPISDGGEDPYRMVQVHDYLNVSFLRMDPSVRAASKETIQTFSMAYPELLKEKFFVNVPLIMGWVFAAMKLFLSPETIRKFHPLSYGSNLAGELPGWGDELPTVYGGKGKDVKEGLTVKYAGAVEVEKD